MFYLLEDNKIIDSNNPPTHWKYLKVIIDEDNKNICVWVSDPREAEFYTIVDKKENVFDLIDWNNDLVKLTFIDRVSFIVHCKIDKSEFDDGYYDVEWISAIYKPNSKGDYIKVWERKEK